MDARDRLPDARGDEVEPVAHLVLDGHGGGADLVGGEEQADAVLDLAHERVLFGGRGVRRAERFEEVGEALLVVEDAAAAGLGRVRRQRRLDVEPADEREHVVERAALGAEAVDGLGDGLAARVRRRRRSAPARG